MGRFVVVGGASSARAPRTSPPRPAASCWSTWEDPGHATAAGAGIVAPGLSLKLPPAWQPLAFAAVAAYQPLLEELREQGQVGIEYQVVGAIHLARSRPSASSFRTR